MSLSAVSPWVLIFGSSLASVLGATFVYSEVLLRKFTKFQDFELYDCKPAISAVLALSSGILFYSSQLVLLPEGLSILVSIKGLENFGFVLLLLLYISGILILYIVNILISFIAPSAIACPCDHVESQFSNHNHECDDSHNHSNHKDHKHKNYSLHNRDHVPHSHSETSSLLPISSLTYSSTTPQKCLPGQCPSSPSLPTSLTDLECQCSFEPILSNPTEPIWTSAPFKDMKRFSHISCATKASVSTATIHINDYNEVYKTDVELHNQLWKVGIQTAVAIALHKLPEGLITVLTAKSNTTLSLGLFIAIACHNLPEGLMLAMPILAATSSKAQSFIFASLIGGLTQPLGGLLALFVVDKVEDSTITLINGLTFPIVSGMMATVSLASVKTAYKEATHPNKKLFIGGWFIGGLTFMAFVSAVMEHV